MNATASERGRERAERDAHGAGAAREVLARPRSRAPRALGSALGIAVSAGGAAWAALGVPGLATYVCAGAVWFVAGWFAIALGAWTSRPVELSASAQGLRVRMPRFLVYRVHTVALDVAWHEVRDARVAYDVVRPRPGSSARGARRNEALVIETAAGETRVPWRFEARADDVAAAIRARAARGHTPA